MDNYQEAKNKRKLLMSLFLFSVKEKHFRHHLLNQLLCSRTTTLCGNHNVDRNELLGGGPRSQSAFLVVNVKCTTKVWSRVS